MVILHITYVAIRQMFIRYDEYAYSMALDGSADTIFTCPGDGTYTVDDED